MKDLVNIIEWTRDLNDKRSIVQVINECIKDIKVIELPYTTYSLNNKSIDYEKLFAEIFYYSLDKYLGYYSIKEQDQDVQFCELLNLNYTLNGEIKTILDVKKFIKEMYSQLERKLRFGRTSYDSKLIPFILFQTIYYLYLKGLHPDKILDSDMIKFGCQAEILIEHLPSGLSKKDFVLIGPPLPPKIVFPKKKKVTIKKEPVIIQSIDKEPFTIDKQVSTIIEQPPIIIKQPSIIVEQPPIIIIEPATITASPNVEPTSIITEPIVKSSSSSVVVEQSPVIIELTSITTEPSPIIVEPVIPPVEYSLIEPELPIVTTKKKDFVLVKKEEKIPVKKTFLPKPFITTKNSLPIPSIPNEKEKKYFELDEFLRDLFDFIEKRIKWAQNDTPDNLIYDRILGKKRMKLTSRFKVFENNPKRYQIEKEMENIYLDMIQLYKKTFQYKDYFDIQTLPSNCSYGFNELYSHPQIYSIK